MQVKLNKKGTVVLVELKGRLDTSLPREFETQLFDLIASGERHLVFDFSQVEQVTTTGLRVLLRVFKDVTYANGRMVFHSLNERVKRVFEIAGLTLIFNICATREEAVASALHTGLLPVNILKDLSRDARQSA